jgi:hypothetical protein
MTTCPVYEIDETTAAKFIETRPGAHRQAAQAISKLAGETKDAEVYSLLARRAADVDLEAEFAALADDAAEWASFTFEASAEVWPED